MDDARRDSSPPSGVRAPWPSAAPPPPTAPRAPRLTSPSPGRALAADGRPVTLGGGVHQPPSPRVRTHTNTRPSHPPPPMVLPAHTSHPFLQVVGAVGVPQERGAAPPLGGQQLRFPVPSTCPLPQLPAPALAPPLCPHRPFSSTPSPSLRTAAPTRRTLPVTGRLPPVRHQDPPPTARVPRLGVRAPSRSRFGGADHWGLESRPPAVTGGSLSLPPPPCTAACRCPAMGQQHLGTWHCGAWSAVPLPSWPRTPGPHQLCCAGPTEIGQCPFAPALVRYRGTQADRPHALRVVHSHSTQCAPGGCYCCGEPVSHPPAPPLGAV